MFNSTYPKNYRCYTICEKCGAKVEVDDLIVCASIPPKYQYKCSKCGKVGYVTGDKLIYEKLD